MTYPMEMSSTGHSEAAPAESVAMATFGTADQFYDSDSISLDDLLASFDANFAPANPEGETFTFSNSCSRNPSTKSSRITSTW